MSNSICVEDFCGYTSPSHFPLNFWADWYPDTGLTKFGGDWQGIPDMYTKECPTSEQVNQWAKEHNGNWWED